MYCPANRLYFFLFCALAVACVHAAFQRRRTRTLLHHAGRRSSSALSLGFVLIALGSIWFNAGIPWAKKNHEALEKVYFNAHIPQSSLGKYLAQSKKSILADPFTGEYHLLQGTIKKFQGDMVETRTVYAHALRLEPMNSDLLLATIPFLAKVDQKSAEEILRSAIEVDPKRLDLYVQLLYWYYSRDRRAEGLKLIARMLADEVASVKWLLSRRQHYSLSLSEMETALPEKAAAYAQLGKYLVRMQKDEDVSTATVFTITDFFASRQLQDEAMDSLRRAIEYTNIQDAALHVRLAEFYMEKGISYRAREEYERALVFKPGDAGLRSILRDFKER